MLQWREKPSNRVFHLPSFFENKKVAMLCVSGCFPESSSLCPVFFAAAAAAGKTFFRRWDVKFGFRYWGGRGGGGARKEGESFGGGEAVSHGSWHLDDGAIFPKLYNFFPLFVDAGEKGKNVRG